MLISVSSIWNEKKIQKCIETVYKLFDLPVPETISKVADPFDDMFLKRARAARAAWVAMTAGADYDFDYFIELFEYSQYTVINKNDKKVIQYGFLMLEALENGLGYYAEHNGTCYIAPAPKVKLDERNRYHSELHSAIEFSTLHKLWFLRGVNLPQGLWKKIVRRTIPAQEAILLSNLEQRTLALQYLGGERLMKELGGTVVATAEYGKLVELSKLIDTNGHPYKYLIVLDPSKGDKVWLRTWPGVKTPAEAEARSYRLERFNLNYAPQLRT